MNDSRRDFIKKTGLLTAGLTAGAGLTQSAFSSVMKNAANKDPFAGIQLGTHSLLAEGIEWVLDFLQENRLRIQLLICNEMRKHHLGFFHP